MALSKWQLEYSPRMIKRMDKIKDPHVIKRIVSAADTLAHNPYSGKLLQGKIDQEGVYSHRFGTRYGEMRILYQILESKQVLLLLIVDTREGIYKLLDRL